MPFLSAVFSPVSHEVTSILRSVWSSLQFVSLKPSIIRYQQPTLSHHLFTSPWDQVYVEQREPKRYTGDLPAMRLCIPTFSFSSFKLVYPGEHLFFFFSFSPWQFNFLIKTFDVCFYFLGFPYLHAHEQPQNSNRFMSHNFKEQRYLQ